MRPLVYLLTSFMIAASGFSAERFGVKPEYTGVLAIVAGVAVALITMCRTGRSGDKP